MRLLRPAEARRASVLLATAWPEAAPGYSAGGTFSRKGGLRSHGDLARRTLEADAVMTVGRGYREQPERIIQHEVVPVGVCHGARLNR